MFLPTSKKVAWDAVALEYGENLRPTLGMRAVVERQGDFGPFPISVREVGFVSVVEIVPTHFMVPEDRVDVLAPTGAMKVVQPDRERRQQQHCEQITLPRFEAGSSRNLRGAGGGSEGTEGSGVRSFIA